MIDIKSTLEQHKLWLDSDGESGSLADLTRADMRVADLDFSCWTLWCGSLNVKLCDKLKAQLFYHTISVVGVDSFTQEKIDFANTFSHVGECGELTK